MIVEQKWRVWNYLSSTSLFATEQVAIDGIGTLCHIWIQIDFRIVVFAGEFKGKEAHVDSERDWEIYLFNSSYRQQVTQVKQHKDKSSAPTTLATAGIYHLHGAKKTNKQLKTCKNTQIDQG